MLTSARGGKVSHAFSGVENSKYQATSRESDSSIRFLLLGTQCPALLARKRHEASTHNVLENTETAQATRWAAPKSSGSYKTRQSSSWEDASLSNGFSLGLLVPGLALPAAGGAGPWRPRLLLRRLGLCTGGWTEKSL